MNNTRSRLVSFGSVCLAGLCFLSAVHALAAVAAPWGNLRLSGSVVLADGTPAAEAYVESQGTQVSAPLRTRTDAEGRYRLVGHFGFGCHLHVRSADEKQQATVSITATEARTRLAKPVDVKLAPAKQYVVKVVSTAGKPVADAHVAVKGETCRADAVTDADGRARVLLPNDAKLLGVVAWHPTLGAAGQSDYQQGLTGETFDLALLPAAPLAIHVIDADGQPVANLDFGVSLRTGSMQWVATDEVADARLQTDSQGRAVVPWMPEVFTYVSTRLTSPDWKIDDLVQNRPAKSATVHVRRKVDVKGRLKMPAGASAEGILIAGFGFGPKNNGDIPTARAAADGTFTLAVAPDHGYALNVTDGDWASAGWTGRILADEKSGPAEIELDVYPATPLEVRVTRGPGHEAVADASIYVRSEQQFSWRNAKGAIRNAMGGRNDWILTAADGVGRIGVGHGKLKLGLRAGAWEEEREITVDAQSPASVEFHRAWLAKRKITGRLITDGAAYKPSSTAKIEAAAQVSSYQRRAAEATLHPDGTFAVEADAAEITVFITDREQRLSGFAKVGEKDATVDLVLKPMAHFAGVLVDQDGNTHAVKKLRIMVKDTDYLAAEEQVTDAAGRFKFALVTAGAPLSLQAEQQADTGAYFGQIDELLFQPDETRDGERVTLDTRPPGERRRPETLVPLKQQLANAVRNARLNGMHVLAILQGDAIDNVKELAESLSNYDEQPEVLSYVPLLLDHKSVQANKAALGDLSWPVPETGEVALVLLDGEGKQLAAERVSASDQRAADKLMTALLKKHLPPTRDAKERFVAARNEAERSGRKLWIVEGGPRCGPCFRLARWMDDQHALLEKDYVILKVMGGLDKHAEEVIKPLNRPESGIPWFAITEPSGTILSTSESPLGNVGMPSSLEEIRYLREMLGKTAVKLTPVELDKLAESLKGFK